MKAAILTAPGNLVVKEVGTPPCPEGGLLVKTRACSICTTDAKMYHQGQRDLADPRILGHEFSGVIAETHTRDGAFEPGDRVQVAPGIGCGRCPACQRGADNRCPHIGIFGFNYDGGFAEFVTVPERSVLGGGVNQIPEGTSFEEAALAEPLASCLNGQQQAGITGGDTVLILGAGPIGLLHARLARLKRATRILIAERLANRLETAELAGAERIIDLNSESTAEVVKEESSGRGVDVILLACREAALKSLLELLAPGGRMCLFSGLPAESTRGQLDANLIHYREISITGAYGCTAAQNRAALELIASGQIDVSRLITRRLSLDEIGEGLEYTGRREGLKATIKF